MGDIGSLSFLSSFTPSARCPKPFPSSICRHLVWGTQSTAGPSPTLLMVPEDKQCSNCLHRKRWANQGQSGSSSQWKGRGRTTSLRRPHTGCSALSLLLKASLSCPSATHRLWSSGLWPFLSSSSVNPGPCIKQLLSPGTWFLGFQSLQTSQILCPGQTPKENCPGPHAALRGRVM